MFGFIMMILSGIPSCWEPGPLPSYSVCSGGESVDYYEVVDSLHGVVIKCYGSYGVSSEDMVFMFDFSVENIGPNVIKLPITR